MLASAFLLALGGWFVVTREANVLIGGSENPISATDRGTPVDAEGLDAAAIGCAIIGLGVINLALGIRSRRRIPVFWAGAALLLLAICYGLWKVALDVYRFASGIG
jgi:hypothetical protein